MTNPKLAMQSCTAFTVNLASRTLLPGGGSAAALIGALSVSLCQMVSSLSVRKKKYASCREDLQHIIHKADSLREDFLQLMDEDAEAFEPLVKAYSLPKRTPGYVDILTGATLTASRLPYRMMESCCDAIHILEDLEGKCNRSMLSDVGCAAIMAKAALEASYLNVLINTRALPGNGEALLIELKAEALLDEYIPRVQKIADTVVESMHRINNE